MGRGAALAPGTAPIIAGPQEGGRVNMARSGSLTTGVRLLILATALTSVATSAQAAKLVVDDDRVQCPQADFTTIQSAIDSLGSNATGTITVCAGSYKESITVAVAHKLKLRSSRSVSRVIRLPTANASPETRSRIRFWATPASSSGHAVSARTAPRRISS
jgi:pectin methylesterase-like acyl-CoA thioesterase